MSKAQSFGIDCGATKIMAQSVLYDSKSQIIMPGNLCYEYSYSESSSWNPNFKPIPIEIQRAELRSCVFNIQDSEKIQASAIVDIIKHLISKLKTKNFALSLKILFSFLQLIKSTLLLNFEFSKLIKVELSDK